MRGYRNLVAYQRFMACFQIILLWSYNAALLDELHWLLGGYFLESFMYCFGRQHIFEIRKIPAEDQRNAPTLKSNLITSESVWSASIFVLNLCYTSERLYSRQTGADEGEGWTVFRVLLFIQDSREFTVAYCTCMLVKTVHFKYIELLFKSKLWILVNIWWTYT